MAPGLSLVVAALLAAHPGAAVCSSRDGGACPQIASLSVSPAVALVAEAGSPDAARDVPAPCRPARRCSEPADEADGGDEDSAEALCRDDRVSPLVKAIVGVCTRARTFPQDSIRRGGDEGERRPKVVARAAANPFEETAAICTGGDCVNDGAPLRPAPDELHHFWLALFASAMDLPSSGRIAFPDGFFRPPSPPCRRTDRPPRA